MKDSAHPQVVYHPAYGPACPEANWVPAPRYLLRRELVMRHLAGVQPCRVLDIGCGPAVLLSELASQGFDAYGVDDSSKALALAEVFNRPEHALTLRNALDPAWKGTFDLMLSFEVIEHLEQDVEAMSDWRAYLKPGGWMILSTPAHPSRWNAADVWAGHVRRYTRAGLVEAIEQAGFHVEQIDCYGFPLANIVDKAKAYASSRALRGASKSDKSVKNLTEESGTDREVETRFWKLFRSLPVSTAMRMAGWGQRRFLQTDLGNGYLVMARRP